MTSCFYTPQYVANMHGNEVRGRGLLLKLAYYLVAMSEDEDVKKILNTTVFHLVPTLNPDGFARAAKSCTGTNGRLDIVKFRNFIHVQFPNFIH